MFWSRLWLFLVTLTGALAISVALLAPQPLQRDLEAESGARLERAQHAASLLLKVNARKWIDTAAQVATDAVLVEALDQAGKGPADLALVHKTVQDRLRYFNEKMHVDLVIATDAGGRVIARNALDESVYRDGVEGFPLVADALRGLRGDDTWSLEGKLYRVAASPVIARDHYAGALIIGQEVGSELAQSMKAMLGVDVAFLLRGRVLAASSQLPVLSRLPVLVEQRAAELSGEGRSSALVVDDGAGGCLTVLAPFLGEAAGHGATYAVLLPRPRTATPIDLAMRIAAVDPKTLPWRTLAPVGGGLLGVLLIGFLLLRLEVGGPIAQLAREAQGLARGEIPRLNDDRHPGKLGTVARAVNTTLDRLAASSRAGMPARSSEASPRAPFAAFSAAPAAPAAPSWEPSLPPQNTSSPRLTPDFERRVTLERPEHAEAGPSDSLVPTDSDPTILPLPAPAGSVIGDTEPVDSGPDFVESPSGSLPGLPTLGRAGAARPAPARRGFEEPTTVASPTEDLLRAATAPLADLASFPSDTAVDHQALSSEFRTVFDAFVETRRSCGESLEGVTFEKFASKLQSNRDQLISRYGCKTVRFQVYIKDGKAALKATPVTA